jgi:hypothetical protein
MPASVIVPKASASNIHTPLGAFGVRPMSNRHHAGPTATPQGARKAPATRSLIAKATVQLEASAPPATTVPVSFSVEYMVGFGEGMYVVGNLEQLGSWNVESSLQLEWTEGHVWRGRVEVPVGSELEFKFLKKNG